MKKLTPEQIRMLAKALADAGVVNDKAEEWPCPYSAAQEAFCICYPGRGAQEWGDLLGLLETQAMPPVAYFRKVSEICLRALRRPHLADDLREPVKFAWGYFADMAKIEVVCWDPS